VTTERPLDMTSSMMHWEAFERSAPVLGTELTSPVSLSYMACGLQRSHSK
jgi:hypothetical protein